ncbi:permease-like cell division protein FtsX [Nonomuraea sp. NPDC059194]|uniref:permease-like cell division protein FtsX n=1 Tax=Nonomuraea sp. NPDC059194 TaxID=3346764 RepID=UPI00368C2302
MNSPMEDRLRDALSAAGATVAPETVRPLQAPAARTRWRVDLRYVAIAVTLAGVVGAMGWWPVEREEPAVLAAGVSISLSALDDGKADMSVFLCKSGSPVPRCQGDVLVDRAAIQRTLEAVPQVQEIRFEDQAANYVRFRRSFQDEDSQLLRLVKAEDMPEAFRLRLRPGTDGDALVAAAARIEGVATVIKHGCRSSWIDRAALRLFGSEPDTCQAP